MNRNAYPFSDLELSRRLERAEAHGNAKFVEARAVVFPETRAEWIEVAGAYAMFDGIESPITQTFGLGLFEPVSEKDITSIEGFFQSRGAPVFHEVSPFSGSLVQSVLSDRAYRPIELSNVLYQPLRRDAQSARSGSEKLIVRPISDGEGDVWAATTVEGWSEYPEHTAFLAQLAEISVRREDAVSLLVELDGQPIAAGSMSIFGGVVLLAGACTIPEARNQGAQSALLDFRLQYAASLGCDLAMMSAQPGSGSHRNAERNGFRVAYTRTKWHLGA